jgi:long-chain acyl-CoA synthetase
MTFDEATAFLTGPGGPLEIVETEVLGRTQRVFSNIPATLRDLFAGLRNQPADNIFLVYEDERWTYGEFIARMEAIAALLVDRYDVQPGDRVAVDMRNYPEWVMSFGAIVSIGAVSVSVNAWWTGPEIEYGLIDSGARVFIADAERIERIGAQLAAVGVRGIAVRMSGELPEGVEHLDEVLVADAPLPEVTVDPDSDATILYTSGTTGNPKGAVSTHRAVLNGLFAFACRGIVEAMRVDPKPPSEDDGPSYPNCFILIVPLFHVTGCVPVMLGSVAGGSRLVMLHKWDPLRALQLIERERVTNFVGVPTMSQDLISHPDFEKYDTSSLKTIGGGGAPMAPELVRKIEGSFEGRGRPQLGYGLTETNGYGPGNTGDDYINKPNSTGRVLPIMQMRVQDDAGNTLAAGEVGEIQLSGPMLIRGYWNRPEATAEAIVDGWLKTGDLGYIDDEGFVFIVDRAKDMVLRGGENVYCAEVEAQIYEFDGVHECAVFGLPHERLGEEVVAAVMVEPGTTLDTAALEAFLAARMATFKIPTQWFVQSEPLVRGATGKILKREIRDRIIAEQG